MSLRVLPRVQLGDSVLRTRALRLTKAEMISDETAEFVSRMYYTLRQTGGVGLAAPQVGISKQLAIVNVGPSNANHASATKPPKKRQRFVMINPQIIASSKKTRVIYEGCLSFIDLFGKVRRPSSIKVRYYDLQARQHTKTLSGLVATVFQHEYDHLQGVVWLDRANDTKSFMTQAEYRKMRLLQEVEAQS